VLCYAPLLLQVDAYIRQVNGLPPREAAPAGGGVRGGAAAEGAAAAAPSASDDQAAGAAGSGRRPKSGVRAEQVRPLKHRLAGLKETVRRQACA